MKYIIFGTGEYCSKYLNYIDTDKILCFVDNNESKIGCQLHGKEICSVQSILQKDYEYIIVLVRDYSAIVEQLLQLKIPEEKIIIYRGLYDIEPIPQRLVAKNSEKTILQWVESRKGKKIFICSYDFSRSGVPVALMNLAILLNKIGYHVLLAAVGNGSLEDELGQNEIDFISDIEVLYANEKFVEQLNGFDLIILGTLVINEVGMYFSKLEIPIVWWLHESYEILYTQYRLPQNRGNIHYYGVGKRVIEKFRKYYPEESIEELLYFLPNIQAKQHNYSAERIFALIGTFHKIKAQDILISAIKELPDVVRQKCIFYFVGVSNDEDRKMMENMCHKFPQIRYIYEMNQKEMANFYQKIDVLVCPSRVDSMPIVVTQALQNGIPCIISDQVGQCEYLEELGGGVIFPSENTEMLKQQVIDFALCSTERLEEYSENAKKVFDLYFSEDLMKKNIKKIFSKPELFMTP